MEIVKRHLDDHDEHGGGALQPHLRPLHHHLHLRCDGHAALRERLRQVRIKMVTVMVVMVMVIEDRPKAQRSLKGSPTSSNF